MLNDEELASFERYRTGFSTLSLAIGGMVPLSLVWLLKPEVFAHMGDRRLKMAQLAFGLTGAAAGYLGYCQYNFLDNMSQKYFDKLSDD